jgi:hypothetical protein
VLLLLLLLATAAVQPPQRHLLLLAGATAAEEAVKQQQANCRMSSSISSRHSRHRGKSTSSQARPLSRRCQGQAQAQQ